MTSQLNQTNPDHVCLSKKTLFLTLEKVPFLRGHFLSTSWRLKNKQNSRCVSVRIYPYLLFQFAPENVEGCWQDGQNKIKVWNIAKMLCWGGEVGVSIKRKCARHLHLLNVSHLFISSVMLSCYEHQIRTTTSVDRPISPSCTARAGKEFVLTSPLKLVDFLFWGHSKTAEGPSDLLFPSPVFPCKKEQRTKTF